MTSRWFVPFLLLFAVLNAGAALYAADVAESIDEGIVQARAVIASGAARAKMQAFVATTQRLAGQL